MRKRFIFPIDDHVYEKVTGTIRETLIKKEKDRKCIVRIVLAAEDILKKLLDNRTDGAENITLLIIRFMGGMTRSIFTGNSPSSTLHEKSLGWLTSSSGKASLLPTQPDR